MENFIPIISKLWLIRHLSEDLLKYGDKNYIDEIHNQGHSVPVKHLNKSYFKKPHQNRWKVGSKLEFSSKKHLLSFSCDYFF